MKFYNSNQPHQHRFYTVETLDISKKGLSYNVWTLEFVLGHVLSTTLLHFMKWRGMYPQSYTNKLLFNRGSDLSPDPPSWSLER